MVLHVEGSRKIKIVKKRGSLHYVIQRMAIYNKPPPLKPAKTRGFAKEFYVGVFTVIVHTYNVNNRQVNIRQTQALIKIKL